MRHPGILIALVLALPLSAQELDVDAEFAEVAALVAALPEPPGAAPEDAAPPRDLIQLGRGVAMAPKRMVGLSGIALFDQGPVDGLEALLVLEGGKSHEALLRADAQNAELVKSAFIAGLDLLHDGVPAPEISALPARGLPLRVRVHWQPDPLLEPDRWVRTDASTLVRDRHTDRGYPALPYVYTGSRIEAIEQHLPDGTIHKQPRFMLDATRSIAVNYDEADALLASPFPLSMRDHLFETNSRIAPRADTPVLVTFERCELPLVLRADGDGALRLLDDQVAVGDGELVEALRGRFAGEQRAELAAVGIVVGPQIPRSVDVAVRKRILAAAAKAGVWAVPVFVDARMK